MKNYSLLFLSLFITSITFAQITKPEVTEVWEPEPRVVTPGNAIGDAPSDAIILFDGKNLDNFVTWGDKPATWKVEDGMVTVVKDAGFLISKEHFDDIQLHLEFRTPSVIDGEGQGRGNSGVFFQGKYEVQILDSYKNRTYSNGQCAAIYKQYPPLVNASKGPGEWQTYDIIFNSPVFNKDGMRVKPGYLTVIHNGVLVQNNAMILGTTEYIGMPKNEAHGAGPIWIQDHGNPMSFRNIWVRKL